MKFIDTHCHLYAEEFVNDSSQVIDHALTAGVEIMLLPNVDNSTTEAMLAFCNRFPQHCFPMAGLHPTSVEPLTVENELFAVETELNKGGYCAVGEIGIDLYWDKTHLGLQEEAFRFQLHLAQKYNLPVAIHVRKSFDEVWKILKTEAGNGLKGVFHCFPGDVRQAKLVTDAGFKLGIGGVVTFKNAGLQQVVAAMGVENLVLETDAPYLAPVPYRGQRNQPSYIPLIATKVAELCHIDLETVAAITTRNAKELFGFK